MQKTILAVAALAVLAVAVPGRAQDSVTVSVDTTQCATYEGAFNTSGFVRGWHEAGHVTCRLVDGVGATCTVRTASGHVWPFVGRFIEDERRLIVEADDKEGRTFQLVCKDRDTCVGFRVFSESKKIGMQCTVETL